MKWSFVHAAIVAALSLPLLTKAQVDHPQATDLLKFDVATIKPIDPNAQNIQVGVEVDPNGVVRLNGYTLKGLLITAYDVSAWQIVGTHGWMESSLYNVVAKPPEALQHAGIDTRHTLFGIADPRLRKMLQELLADRFQIRLHETTTFGKVYILRQSGKKSALQPSKTSVSGDSSGRNGVGNIGFAEMLRKRSRSRQVSSASITSMNSRHSTVIGCSSQIDATTGRECSQ